MERLKLKKNIPKRTKPKITLLVDLKHIAYRMRYTQGTQLTYNEVNTTIFYGTISSLLSAAKKFEVNKVVICADIGSSDDSRRREQYPEYKMKKYSKPLTDYDLKLNELFKEEYNNLIDEFEEIGFGANYLHKYEAGDVIALYCLQHPEEKIVILSRDEDMYQLLTENVMLWSPDDKIKKTDKWFKKEYGIDCLDWNMVKAMAGCSSDGVKGIKGIGEETALKYLHDECNPNQLKKIKDDWETVEQCLQVVTLPHPDLQENGYKFDFVESKINIDKFIVFCQKFGFRSFLNEINDFKQYFGGKL